MIRRLALLTIFLAIIAACQTVPQTTSLATEAPFPTMTVGQELAGRLPTAAARPNVFQSNPAALSGNTNRATATPNSSRCPFPNDNSQLSAFPASRVDAISTILEFLNDGGTNERLREAILSRWDAFGENGYVDSIDLTGEGTPEIILGYIAPGDVGTLLIFACQEGRYLQLYEAINDGIDPPQLITVGDINNSPPAELVFARRRCTDAETCDFQTQIIAWAYTLGRFVNLLPETLLTLDVPELRDIDNDRVEEIVVALDNNGTAATGPLRTGVNIYDWNGQTYVLSIIQLDPPGYHIQVIIEGDKAFSQQNMADAIQFYTLALTDEDLRYWFNDGPINTISYGQFRLILAYAYLGNSAGIITTLDQMNAEFLTADTGDALSLAPVYVHMANTFVDALSNLGDLHEACLAVQSITEERPESLRFINRFGSRNPRYTALDLCPY
jgi:hypothetical protein